MTLILLIISVAINLFFVWYVYNLLKKLLFVSENIEDFLEILKDYSDHVETIYNMETYYGDETIEHLLTYSKEVVQEIKTYEEIYTLMYDRKEEQEDYGEET
jgi:hypothetical protein